MWGDPALAERVFAPQECWALRLGLTRWDLFGTIGLHSLAVLQGDASEIRTWLADIPPASRPRVFMDIGDND